MAYLEARHRLHARMEDRIKGAKECGLANFPCSSFQANLVWLLLVRSGRRTTLRLNARWPWAQELAAAFTSLRTLPLTT